MKLSRKASGVQISIRTKIISTIVSLLLLVSIATGFTSYYIAKQRLEDQGKVTLQNTVHMILMLIDAKNEEVKRGAISLEEAQEQVKTYILSKAQETGKTVEVVSNQAGDKKTLKEIKRTINKDIVLGKNGYPIIYSKDGTELAHPSLEGTNVWATREKGRDNGLLVVQEQLKAAARPEGGFVTYAWTYPNSTRIGDKITFQKTDPNWGWVVVAGTYMSDFNEGANDILRLSGIVMLAALLVALLISLVVVNRIVRPLLSMVQSANELASGDFSDKPRKVHNHDEVGLLANAIRNLRNNVRDMLTAIHTSADKLYESAEQLSAGADQSAQASGQVAGAVSVVAMAAEKQLQSSERASAVVGDIYRAVIQVLENAGQVSGSAHQAAQTANEGEAIITQVVSQMKVIAEKTHETYNAITALDEKSKEIGQIVDVISGIASQTNLLALNAAIEAARAGESGRGFSVVADEVRKLAEQSHQAASRITSLISDVQTQTDNAVTYMNDGRREVEEGAKVVTVAGHNFSNILSMVNQMNTGIQEIYHRVETVTTQADDAIRAVSEITEESKRTNEEAQTISAATEEQSASAEQISAASESLSHMAETMKSAVGRFHL